MVEILIRDVGALGTEEIARGGGGGETLQQVSGAGAAVGGGRSH